MDKVEHVLVLLEAEFEDGSCSYTNVCLWVDWIVGKICEVDDFIDVDAIKTAISDHLEGIPHLIVSLEMRGSLHLILGR